MATADSIPALLGGIISMILAMLVILKNRKKQGILFSLFCLSLAVHGFGTFFTSFVTSPDLALVLNKIGMTGNILAVPLFIHFTYVFLDHRKTRFKLFFFYFLSLLFFLSNLGTGFFTGIETKPGGFTGVPGFAFQIFAFYLISAVIYVIYEYSKAMRHAGSFAEKNRQKYFITLLMMPAIAGILDSLRKAGIVYLVPILLIEWGIIIFVVGCTYAILKYHLLDINIIFKKSVMYSIIGAVVLILFEVLKFILGESFKVFLGITNPEVSAISVLILAFTFEPIRVKTEKIFDRIFIKKTKLQKN
ncbi:MAG: hypothetical protein KKF44_05645 [Nanoarchaeota archaeon]|nr:hypothetical protein [Nanoarchaeota archaeon]